MGRAIVASKGFAHVSISREVAAKIAAFIESNEWGYRSRAEVVTAAIRRFIEQEGGLLSRVEVERALRAVAATEPATPTDLLDALLAELDMKVAHGAQAGTSGTSNSDSTKRR